MNSCRLDFFGDRLTRPIYFERCPFDNHANIIPAQSHSTLDQTPISGAAWLPNHFNGEVSFSMLLRHSPHVTTKPGFLYLRAAAASSAALHEQYQLQAFKLWEGRTQKMSFGRRTLLCEI